MKTYVDILPDSCYLCGCNVGIQEYHVSKDLKLFRCYTCSGEYLKDKNHLRITKESNEEKKPYREVLKNYNERQRELKRVRNSLGE